MKEFQRTFGVATPPQRKVSFRLSGQDFECRPFLTSDVMLDYMEGLSPDPDDPTQVGIPLPVAVKFIKEAITNEEDRQRFDKVVRSLPFDGGPEAVHAIREYLIETYSGQSPTDAPRESQPGRSLNGDSSTDDSGQPESTRVGSPSTAI